MYTIRRIEITSDNFYKNKDIRGFCHLADGQEAIAVGMEAAITHEDNIISAYRIHPQAYMRGETPHQIFAEMFGRHAGSSKGKGGSMHFYNKETNFYGGNGIVGAQIPVGVGLAFALKYKKKPNVAVIMFGDGAANQGQVYEANNMACLWKLPAIFVCENNRYGMGTSIERAAANHDFYTRGHPAPGIRIDGQNVLAVREYFKFAKEWSLKNGPLWIEIETYRYHGHSMSDPGISYRNRDEVSQMRSSRDPIDKVKGMLLENGEVTEQEIEALEKKIKDEINHAAEKAKAEAYPEPIELFKDIYDPSHKVKVRNVEFKESVSV
eukprot:CAMPEP_0202948338 /NCGR_PEP_ID=MMETSP1395-20130829/13252_1 /ASSEMBLY_ACC=CAM_ASM_000871 /TAXON_ID=5961 /ORGANISM="Blepharisma japonicum, Strain Stock R1072" /LENGTH=322 /DNA_ID=CAMNT_0049650295 /DNA_START=135 /DNA_END=1103 /DNA_ORIENTATION=+